LKKSAKTISCEQCTCTTYQQRLSVAEEIKNTPEEECTMSGHDEHHDDPHGYGHDEPDVAAKVGVIFICVTAALYLIYLF
jgi:hypothetical protein